MSQSVSRCPDDETMAAWVEGRLSKAETDVLIEHASVCEECMPMIDAANETFHAEVGWEQVAIGSGWQRWLLAAAAVLAVGLEVKARCPGFGRPESQPRVVPPLDVAL